MSLTTEPALYTKLGFDAAYLPTFEDKVFIEGPQTARRLTNFFTLLLLATVIATYGVLSNSTATVIGAMIVAPLMGPMMAITSAVIMGSLPRAVRALVLTVVGSIAVIIFSYLLALIVPDFTISFTSNGEIASRINPGLYALLTALGAGAAGAFIISRSEIADALGGVAIAISLVPPLCVVGISLRAGQIGAAIGSLLLFTTNFLAILFAGGLVLMIIGLGKSAVSLEQTRVRRRGLVLFIVCLVLIAIPLSLTAYENIASIQDNNTATATIENWLQGTPYQVDSVSVNGKVVSVTIDGTGQLKPLQQLSNQLARVLRRPILVYMRTVPAQNSESNGP
ncbi:MAG TPA: DUF389 domain-containing protein [Ktedonobacteraceae bacterium]|nr:DUF389 domain-containing protein [Ktedonobacteraceae bacterium]